MTASLSKDIAARCKKDLTPLVWCHLSCLLPVVQEPAWVEGTDVGDAGGLHQLSFGINCLR